MEHDPITCAQGRKMPIMQYGRVARDGVVCVSLHTWGSGVAFAEEIGERCLPIWVIERNSPIVCWHWLGSRSTETICWNLCIDECASELDR